MSFDKLVATATTIFPDIQVKYKDESTFMKVLGTILFFNPSFMTDFVTTIGSTIYFPSRAAVQNSPDSFGTVFMHEMVHVHDQKTMGKIPFGFLYLLPQLLSLICFALLFVISWKIMLPLAVLFLLPIPAYFRMCFERRAYLSSLYTHYKMSKISSYNYDPASDVDDYVGQFTSSSYYFMWPFKTALTADFNNAVALVASGQRPYQDPIFDILDQLVVSYCSA